MERVTAGSERLLAILLCPRIGPCTLTVAGIDHSLGAQRQCRDHVSEA